MKSEERHKLQQNELADYLAKIVERIKPYQNAILGGIIMILVVVLLVRWWTGKSATESETANAAFYNALNGAMGSNEPAELIAVAEKYPDNSAAPFAALAAADMYLNNGSDMLFQNKAKANADLGDAVALYQKILPSLNTSYLIAKANFGLARAQECQNQLSEAKKHYEEVVKIQPDGPYGVLAKRRLENLNLPATKEYYDKFAKFEPPPFKDEPGMSDKSPLFDPSNLPREPLIKSDSFGEKLNLKTEPKEGIKTDAPQKDALPLPSDQPATEEKKSAEKPTEEKAPGETKPADATTPSPESVNPAEEKKPAPDEKPTPEEKPAPEEKPSAPPPAPETPAPADTPK
jgi:predicted negative regulator of RcsB-dependent stress response